MVKRALRDGREPARKRARQAQTSRFTLESLSEELILHCLVLLSHDELLKVAAVSRHFNRLSNDDQVCPLLP